MDDDEASLAFSRTLMQRARRGRITVNAEGDRAEAENPILAAMREHDAAVKTGSETEIARTRQRVEALLAEGRPSWREAAGTRPGRQEPPSMTELLRRARDAA